MVELKLDTVEGSSLPADCYVSVRVGETQKLSKLSAARLYRFPQAGDRRYGKIEVFRRIGACSIDVDATNQNLREVAISCEEAGFGILGMKVQVKNDGGQQRSADLEATKKMNSSNKVQAAKEYLAKHSLEMRLSDAMQAVLRERPDDPGQFMADKLMSAGVKLPPLRSTAQGQGGGAGMPQPQKAEPLSPVPPASRATKPQASRPLKLDPLQKGADQVQPPRAAGQGLVPGEFHGYYAAHFGSMLGATFDGLHAKFGSRKPAPARRTLGQGLVPGEFHGYYAENFGSMLGTTFDGLHAKFGSRKLAPARRTEAPAKQMPARFKPSIGTWLQMPRPLNTTVEVTQLELMRQGQASWAVLPSVGTWMKPLPRRLRATEAVPLAALAAVAVPSPGPGATFAHRPSVATWIMHRPRTERDSAEDIKAINAKKPSVGTWLVHRLEPEALATAVLTPSASASTAPATSLGTGSMVLMPQAVCGPAYSSLNMGNGMLQFI